MSANKIAYRYSVALLDLSAKQSDLEDKISRDLLEISKLYQDKEIKKIIASPIVNPSLLSEVFATVTRQLQSPDLLRKFLGVLVENRRTALLPDLARSYRSLVQKTRGEVDALLTAAVNLQEQESLAIKNKLAELLHKKVNLVQQTDSSILGGLVIRVENTVLDMSLKTKLEQMTKFAVS